jgi:uncharacterized membrane protein YfcA
VSIPLAFLMAIPAVLLYVVNYWLDSQLLAWIAAGFLCIAGIIFAFDNLK